MTVLSTNSTCCSSLNPSDWSKEAHHHLPDREFVEDGGQSRIVEFAPADGPLDDIAAITPARFDRSGTNRHRDGRIFLGRSEQAGECASDPRVIATLANSADERNEVLAQARSA